MTKGIKGSKSVLSGLESLDLMDYKVRVLENNKGSGARVRVWMKFQDEINGKEERWGTIGVSTNIIEASWLAFVDGINYRLQSLGETKKKASKKL